MGVYTRFKKNPEGLRQLVELLESTPASRRQKMIDVGMAEDPDYTRLAMQYMLTFEDAINLPDLELAEVLSQVPGRFLAFAIYSAPEEVKNRFILKALPKVAGEIKEFLDTPNVSLSQIAGAQMKVIEILRKLEKRGAIKTKRIPGQ
jgi:flagellar motor switch protein FliG